VLIFLRFSLRADTHKIGFRLNNSDGKRRERGKPEATIEFEEAYDAEERITAACDMLFETVPPIDDSKAPVEQESGSQLPLF
jgi:hypothetical protein